MMTNVQSSQSKSHHSLYEEDYYQWLLATVKQLQNSHYSEVDWENLLEELESLAKAQKRELKSRLIILIEHLLKLAYWENEREYNARGWKNTIIEQRRQIQLLLEDSPSLQPILADLFDSCYARAKQDTSYKTGLALDLFPQDPPFNFEQALNFDYFYHHD